MRNSRRRPTTLTANSAIDAAIELGKNAIEKLDLRPILGPIIDQYKAETTADFPTPEDAIGTCREAITALGREDAHAGSIMANAMGKLRKAYNRSMGQARACIDRGDTKGALRHLDEAQELERTIGIVDAREPVKKLHAAIKNVRVTVKGVPGTFPLSGAIAGTRGYKYVKMKGQSSGQFMRV